MTTIHCEVKECVANRDGECQGEEIWIDKTACCEQLEYEEGEDEMSHRDSEEEKLVDWIATTIATNTGYERPASEVLAHLFITRISQAIAEGMPLLGETERVKHIEVITRKGETIEDCTIIALSPIVHNPSQGDPEGNTGTGTGKEEA